MRAPDLSSRMQSRTSEKESTNENPWYHHTFGNHILDYHSERWRLYRRSHGRTLASGSSCLANHQIPSLKPTGIRARRPDGYTRPGWAGQSPRCAADMAKSYAEDVFCWCLVPDNRHQTHKAHQASDTVAATLVIVALHVPCHLARPVPRRFQELLVPSRDHASHNPDGQWMISMNRKFSALSPTGW